jgi:anaerobic selenocysteine-containing dehydrogenase
MRKETVCRLCSACCPVSVDIEDDTLVRAERKSFLPPEKRHRCPKLDAAPEIVYSPQRVLTPLIKVRGTTGNRFREAPWACFGP